MVYHGSIPLQDPITGSTFSWTDTFNTGRLYLTSYAIPGKLDVLAGLGVASNQFTYTTTAAAGTFVSEGAFLGGMYYARPHLNLGARYDVYRYATQATSSPSVANGFSIQVSAPFENNLFIASYDTVFSEQPNAGAEVIQGLDHNFKVVWRFLY